MTTDHLGSTRVVTSAADVNGNVTVKARYDYLPFGEEIPSTIGLRGSVGGYIGADSTRQKFTKKERDSESGLDYFLARYYSSAQGRFTSPDEFAGGPREFWVLGSGDTERQALPYATIANPQSLNKYQYSFNNPLRFVDTDGHQSGEDILTKFLEFIGLYTPTPTPNAGRQAILDQRIPLQDGMTVGDANQVMLKATEQAGKNVEAVLSAVDPTGSIGMFASAAKGDTKGAVFNAALMVLSEGKPVLLGENMKGRVIPVAEEIGARVYKPIGEATVAKTSRWIGDVIGSGKRILDIGTDATRQGSKFYQEEVRRLKKAGFEQIRVGKVKIDGVRHKIYEWVRKETQ